MQTTLTLHVVCKYPRLPREMESRGYLTFEFFSNADCAKGGKLGDILKTAAHLMQLF